MNKPRDLERGAVPARHVHGNDRRLGRERQSERAIVPFGIGDRRRHSVRSRNLSRRKDDQSAAGLEKTQGRTQGRTVDVRVARDDAHRDDMLVDLGHRCKNRVGQNAEVRPPPAHERSENQSVEQSERMIGHNHHRTFFRDSLEILLETSILRRDGGERAVEHRWTGRVAHPSPKVLRLIETGDPFEQRPWNFESE